MIQYCITKVTLRPMYCKCILIISHYIKDYCQALHLAIMKNINTLWILNELSLKKYRSTNVTK